MRFVNKDLLLCCGLMEMHTVDFLAKYLQHENESVHIGTESLPSVRYFILHVSHS